MSLSEFRASYRSVLHDHVMQPGEDSLRAGYELGREAVSRGLSLLELTEIHNEALLHEMRLGVVDAEDVVRVGGQILLETVSAFEMVRLGFKEARDAALLQRSHVEMLRQMSNFLADTSLASDSREALEEVLRLIAEQACELIKARMCVVNLTGYGRLLEALSYAAEPEEIKERAGGHLAAVPLSRAPETRLAAALRSLNGKELGSIEVFGDQEFTDVDQAALVHLSQMVSATVERLHMHMTWDGN